MADVSVEKRKGSFLYVRGVKSVVGILEATLPPLLPTIGSLEKSHSPIGRGPSEKEIAIESPEEYRRTAR